MRYTLLTIAIIFCLKLTAQYNTIDSLNKELKKWEAKTGIQADTILYSIYYNIGMEFLNSNPDTAIYFLNKSIFKAKQLKDPLREAKSIRQKGWSHYRKGDYSQAMELYQTALKKLPENLSKKDKIKKEEIVAAILGNIGLIYHKQGDYSKALEYHFEALKINQETYWNDGKVGNKMGQTVNLVNIGIVYQDQGNYPKALENYLKAQEIDEEIGNKQGQANNLVNIGLIYDKQGDYTKALEYYFRSLKISEQIGYKSNQAVTLGNIGVVYAGQGNYVKALEYYFKALKINKEIGNKSGQAYNYGSIGVIYKKQSEYNKALEYYFKTLKFFEENGNKYGQAGTLGNIGIIYKQLGDSAYKAVNTAFSEENYTKALAHYFKALKIFEEIGSKYGQAINLENIGALYTKQRKYKEAEQYLKDAIQLGEELHIIIDLIGFYNSLFELYNQTGRHKEALEAYKTYVMHRDSLNSEENQKALIQKEMQYEYEKKAATDSITNAKEKEIKDVEIAKQQVEIKAKRNQQYALFGGLVMVLLFAGFVYNRLKITQKQKIIIEQQKHLVEEKHKEITDSINYAERIQRSFLATREMLDKYLGVTSSADEGGVSRSERNYFVFFRPKDVVSGDFYWAGELNNGNFAFSVADSTGHGVPGAIMSILNISSLEKSIEKETEADKILNQTRRIIIDRLKKDGSEEGGKDGMDCTLMVIDKNRTQLSFAAANNPVFIIRPIRHSVLDAESDHEIAGQASKDGNFELFEFKPDKMPVGKHDKDAESFRLQTASLQPGDVIYTLTDGFPDQFGGEKGKKYMIKNLKELLVQIAHLPMHEQEQKLAEEFEAWKGQNEQVDDVCIIGVRI